MKEPSPSVNPVTQKGERFILRKPCDKETDEVEQQQDVHPLTLKLPLRVLVLKEDKSKLGLWLPLKETTGNPFKEESIFLRVPTWPNLTIDLEAVLRLVNLPLISNLAPTTALYLSEERLILTNKSLLTSLFLFKLAVDILDILDILYSNAKGFNGL